MRQFTWDDLQYFLAVAKTGQLTNAARRLRTNHVTVSRRIDRLEEALSARLFERSPRGYILTALGEKLIESAEIMEREAVRFQSEAAGGTAALSGVVRLSILEGIANFFLADRLPLMAQSHPSLSIEMVTIQQIVSLSRREADLSITLNATRTGRYHQEKLTLYRLFVYGSRSYLERHSTVRQRSDLSTHQFIGYIEDMIFTPGLDYMREILPGLRASYQSSSIFSQLSAARSGFGLCILPYYIARNYPELVPVLPKQLHLNRDYWLICHEDIVNTPRIRVLREFIKSEVEGQAPMFEGRPLLT
ncbi:LysR family transcriptional regulator [Phyllobacterium sp. 21LDTY02-6]|jgi:DNA-binding transcriptional LysR family regulator|uniref:LysR family transcriptional regulator n=1 Tax=unclassified Phyllobacterium TaxID=2638441 RepID=UPI002020699D|nr:MULTISPECIES: LysR family transcriptional regulator [unclassified Phyllobacterium]MCO4319463.1 LysR family transcriptional regulator [Phyllobacterium sp. 21LDTY02-6]MCX8279775.1 LysR family transcriptional regulator [Phyllobacterium sp. 0TCS1.6C]MCX8295621.1 LysR family transcriptional regulator [Phyllobacterium sp. 0TCS1.6A]